MYDKVQSEMQFFNRKLHIFDTEKNITVYYRDTHFHTNRPDLIFDRSSRKPHSPSHAFRTP